MSHILVNVANWHADKACSAYLAGLTDMYAYHIHICDIIRKHLRSIVAP